MLVLSELTKAFGGRVVLDEVSVEIPSGSVNFVMGPNGIGKTTLIWCVLGLHRYRGEITWHGDPVDPAQRRVFPVFDNSPFHPELTGLRNLRMLAPESVDGSSVYLSPEVLRRRVKGYSHGERTRLALMGAFNSGADLVILDEPTNGLDRDSMRQLKAEIQARKPGMTFIVTGHNLEFYDDIVDNVFVIAHGKVSRVEVLSQCSDRKADLARVYDEHYPGADR